jgi:PP-loop superfamily ATP-utilizing enzyme
LTKIKAEKSAIVTFSRGVDSSVVAKIASGERVIVKSISLPPGELENVKNCEKSKLNIQ